MSSDPKLYAFIHNEIVPLESACLHVSDISIQRGYGVFDYFKCEQGQPLFLTDYLARFYESARQMELTVPYSEEELKSVLTELTRKNDHLGVSGVKMILTGGYSANGFDPGEPNLIIIQQPLSLPGDAMLEKGIKVITQDYVREFPAVKTINYSMGVRLIKKIKANQADDVLYHLNGVVSEFPRCNFFIVRNDNTVITPDKNILSGITRKNVMLLAGKKYKVEEGTVTLEDIREAKEAFLTSTTKRILPIVQVDDMLIGDGKPGAVTLALLEDLKALELQHRKQDAIRFF